MFFENLDKLCKQNNSTITATVKELGLSTSSVTSWRHGAIPNGDTIILLAKHFNTTTDYLLLGEKSFAELKETEKEWLNLYHQLSDHDKVECIGFVKGYIAGRKESKSNKR